MEQLISARPTGLNISWRTSTPAWATAIDSPMFMYDCSWNEKKKHSNQQLPNTAFFIHCCLRFPLTEQSSWQVPTQVTLDLVYWLVSFKGILLNQWHRRGWLIDDHLKLVASDTVSPGHQSHDFPGHRGSRSTFSPMTIRYVGLKFSEITEFVIYSFNI